ncbi:immunoglobulin superfamily member 5 isoform X2 [Cololabis saira]|uniref:immunoglobulin superfamily member 5 isoform X2 n=1 Tax=Cololabis saira TaxID=129043 RepID=UPI002AD58C83|nr:immunoglobulin superfamily member 5 isoform X2 [Cololabis saira]
MDIFSLLVLLLSLRIEAGAQVTLSPMNLVVVRGEEARFTCSTTSSKWTVMTWLMNNRPVLTISKDTGLLRPVYQNVTAIQKPSSNGDSWVFILNSTERHNQGGVTCDLQHIDSRTAKLSVQEAGSVSVSGGNRLAFKGHSVVFHCEAAGWHPPPRLQWQVDDKKVSQDKYNISTEKTEGGLFTVTSNLSITAARRSHVDCLASVSALCGPRRSGVDLTVVAEVLQEGDDCTVPLAVTAALCALLLLVLLCICTVLCYRQRKQTKANPQEPTRFDQSVFGISSVAGATGGLFNLGYSSEGPTDADCSALNMGTCSRMDFVSFHKIPDVVHSSSPSLHTESQTTEFQEDESYDNVRRITTV